MVHYLMPTELHQLRLHQGHCSQCRYHVSSSGVKSWWLQTQKLQGGYSSDMMVDNTGHRHQLRGERTAHSTL
jgi:hypothetical protein